MSRRFAAVLVAVGLASGLVAGCGIPDHTEVKVEGAGPSPGSGAATSEATLPEEWDAATTEDQFVRNLLEAPAGEVDRSEVRLRKYFSPELADKVTLKKGVAVVRVTAIDIDKDKRGANLTVEQVGVLDLTGAVLEADGNTKRYHLDITAAPGGHFQLSNVPSVLPLLNVEALDTYYSERPIYYWNTDRSALVPDLRWVPREVGDSRLPTVLLQMMATDPSPSLDGVATGLATGSKLLVNAPLENGQLTMNWSPSAVNNGGEESLARQAAWTVRGVGLTPRTIQLKINGQARGTFETSDLIDGTNYPIGPDEHAYAILDGKVRAIEDPVGSAGAIPLDGAADQNVHWAAFNRTADALTAAVVVTSANRLALRVGNAPAGSPVTALTTVAGITPTSPPAWLPGSATGLVVADGRLYSFGAAGQPKQVALPIGVSGPITAVATAPDGQRIALIAARKLYVVPVSVGQDGTPTLGKARPLDVPLTDPTAVAWSSETALSVGGGDKTGAQAIFDITVDGARVNQRIKEVQGEITMIAAYPESIVLSRPTTVLYQADNLSWLARGGVSTQLDRATLAGDTATPSPGTEEPSQPVSPFFVY